MSLTSCLKAAGKALDATDKAAIIDRARALRGEGKSAAEAAAAAVDERLGYTRTLMDQAAEVEAKGQVPARSPEADPQVAKEDVPRQAGQDGVILRESTGDNAARIDELVAKNPDLRVMLPGHDTPMTLAAAMRQATDDATLMRSDADLVRAAVACALMNGAALA